MYACVCMYAYININYILDVCIKDGQIDRYIDTSYLGSRVKRVRAENSSKIVPAHAVQVTAFTCASCVSPYRRLTFEYGKPMLEKCMNKFETRV